MENTKKTANKEKITPVTVDPAARARALQNKKKLHF